MRGFLKLRTPFEMEIIQDFYNHGATKTWRVLGTFKNNLLLWAPLPSNYNTSVGVQSLSTSPATVNCLSCQQGAYAFSPCSLPRCHTRAGLSNFPESWQGHFLAAGSFLRAGWHKPLRREQEWNRRVNIFCTPTASSAKTASMLTFLGIE